MNKIAVVVDSTSVIDQKMFDENSNLYSIPLHIIFGNQSFRDGIDLKPSDFFTKLDESCELPTTSQPSIGEAVELFDQLLEQYDKIIYITISSKISGTFQSGVLASNQVTEDKVIVFDSLYTSVIQKQMAIETLDLIKREKSIQEILDNLKYLRSNSTALFVVDDLKHLHRTGRIGLASASIGTVLRIKPILTLEDGQIIVKKKIRTVKKAHKDILNLIEEQNLNENSKIMIAHADGLDYATRLHKEVNELYPNHDIFIDELSPVISVHTGPKTLVLTWINKTV